MSQHPTAPSTKNGTSPSSSPKKRGRPKGWKKAKASEDFKVTLEGNSDFKITPEVEANIATYTAEDAALDAELEQLAKQRPQVTEDAPAAAMEVVKPRESLEHLSAHVDGEYKPASNMAELQEQVHLAKQVGADSIDGTEALIRMIFRVDFDKIKASIGYGIYHNIRVYLDGMFDGLKNMDKMTMEQKLHSTDQKKEAVKTI